MIEFLTLFLGIVAGPQEVALLADLQVTRVEPRVDGDTVAKAEVSLILRRGFGDG